jgi:DNA-binding response OmpR family regulator
MENNSPLILTVEDDKNLNMINRLALESEGYRVKTAYDLKEARLILDEIVPDLILLDVKLPDGNGFDFCREIREKVKAPIIFLTSVTETEGEHAGLAAGGDEYLRKPYDIDLLRLRVKKTLRRERQVSQIIRYGSLTLDVIANIAYLNGKDLLLSQKEFALLLLFVQNEGRMMSADYLYEKVWRQPMLEDARTVKYHISNLRKKLSGSGYTVAALRGEGYCFERVCAYASNRTGRL